MADEPIWTTDALLQAPSRSSVGATAWAAGPYEKSGLVEDSSLPPLRTVTSSYEIFFPFEEKEHEEGDTVRSFPSDSLEIEVKLWYLPYGTMWDDAFLWREEKRTVTISMAGK